jgi:hypothetical protein
MRARRIPLPARDATSLPSAGNAAAGGIRAAELVPTLCNLERPGIPGEHPLAGCETASKTHRNPQTRNLTTRIVENVP